jgi:hypothetical protein
MFMEANIQIFDLHTIKFRLSSDYDQVLPMIVFAY